MFKACLIWLWERGNLHPILIVTAFANTPSTGGIIALGLTVRNMTVEHCANQFEELCKQAFTARKGTNVPGLAKLVQHYNQSKYETQPFEEALRSAFSDKQYLFGGQREDNDRIDINVAVTATSAAGSPVVLSNYNRLCLDKSKSSVHQSRLYTNA